MPATEQPTSGRTHTAPYVGLTHFGEDRADIFFGRDSERALIIGNLRAARLTLLYAQSGVGKSSLLRAGVAARLHTLARRSITERGGAGYVPVVFSSWRDEPIAELRRELRRAVQPFVAEPIPDFDGAGLDEAIHDTAVAANATLLVILDQFEEYFLYSTREAQAHAFADELAACIARTDLRANFLIAVREDAYAGLGDLFRGKISNLYGNYLHLDYLDRAAARQAILRPVEHFNSTHPDQDPVEVEPALVEAVLDQVRAGRVAFEHEGRGVLAGQRDAGEDSERIETPYLQLVMSALWDHEMTSGQRRLRLSTLTKLGGAERIVRSHLDTAMSRLSEQERDTAAEFFNHLVTPSGTKIAHTIADLAEYSRREPAEVQLLIDRLTSGTERILRPVPAAPGDDGRPRVEIFHDVLAPAILAWRSGRTAERLEGQKQAAESRAAAERGRARIFRATAVISLILLVAAILAAVLARSETARAVRAQNAALSHELAADARADLQRGAVDRSALLSLEAFRYADGADARTSLVAAIGATQTISTYLGGHTADLTGVAYSPDGKLIASSDATGTVLVNAAAGGRLVRAFGGPGASTGVAFSPDGKFIASGGVDGTITLWNVAAGRQQLSLHGHDGGVFAVTFSPDGRTLSAGYEDNTIALWDVKTGRQLRLLRGHTDSVNTVAYDRSGSVLASGGADGTVILWDMRTGRRLRTLMGHGGGVNAVAFALTPDGNTLATADDDGMVILWNPVTGRRLTSVRAHNGPVNALAYNSAGTELASAGADHAVTIWDGTMRRRIAVLQGHSANVESLSFDPSGSKLASGGDDGHLIVWDLEPRLLKQTLPQSSPVLSVAFSPAGTLLAAGTAAGSVTLRELPDGPVVRTLAGDHGPVEDVAFRPTGQTLAAANADGTLTLWNPVTGRRERTWSADSQIVYSVTFSPDGRTLASAGADGTVVLWQAETGARERTLRGHSDFAFGVAFSPDGRTLASASADHSIILWDVASGRRMRTLTGHTAAVESVAFSPDGRTIASGSKDGTVILWNARTGRQIGDRLSGSGGSVLSLAFSPDGRLLASAGAAKRALLWDLRSRLALPVGDHTGCGGSRAGWPQPPRSWCSSVENVAFSPDGRTLATAGLDGKVELSGPLPSTIAYSAVRARICGVVRRSMTRAEWSQFVPGQPYRPTCG